MPNPWFRLYSEFADDPKVQILPEHMQRRLVMLFCERCKCETLHETQRAFHWRITPAELAETKALFIQSGFIDDNWFLVNWNRRQFLSDSSTERVRRFRQGLKQDETLHETVVPVTVTAPDTEADTEAKKKPSPNPRKRVSEGDKKRAKKIRDKAPTKTDFAKARHKEFKVAIFEYWQSKNTAECPWGPAEGAQLEIWLKAVPNTTIRQFKEMLRNRYRSEVNHSQRPSAWIRNVTDFAAGPTDRFNKQQGDVLPRTKFDKPPLNDVPSDAGFERAAAERRSQELEGYAMWQQMSAEYKAQNPWKLATA